MEAIFIRVPGVQSRANRAREGQTNAGLRSKERIGDVHIRSAAILRAAFFRFFGFFFQPAAFYFILFRLFLQTASGLSLAPVGIVFATGVCVHS